MLIRSIVAAALVATSVTVIHAGPDSCCGPVSPAGHRLLEILDNTNVEALWLAHEHVNWETGEPDKGADYEGPGTATHCSAFAAAVAKRAGVYMLRPPEHGQILLANAQYEWLAEEGARERWQPVRSAGEAQDLANRGMLVVATYRNHHDDKPGHIAIVRPSEKTAAQIEREGPQITQAGATNYLSTPLQHGFAGHPAAWTHHEVRYYAHAIDWSRVTR